MTELRVGWAKTEITPPLGYPMAGYVRRQGPATGVLDPLFARAFVLRSGSVTAVLVIADLLLISNRWARELRVSIAQKLKIPRRNVIVAATHTHSGPWVDTSPFDFVAPGPRPRGSYLRELNRKILGVALAARERAAPVELSFARTWITGVASDRNHPQRHCAQPFFQFRFRGATGDALFGVYGCHSTVLGYSNRLFSGDLLGGVARHLEGAYSFAAVSVGAAANISTRFTRRSQTAPEVERLASLIARQALAARFRSEPSNVLGISEKKVRLPLKNLLGNFSLRRSARLPQRLREAAEEAEHNLRQLRSSSEFRRGVTSVAVTQIDFGSFGLLACPTEISFESGERLWRDAKVIPWCCANGYWGYLPARHASSEDYEVISSPFSPMAEPVLREAVLTMRPFH